SYTVVWSVLSRDDGHVSSGYYSFTVGNVLLPTDQEQAAIVRRASTIAGAPLLIDAAVRWLNLLGQAVLIGALAFVPFVLAPLASGRQAPPRMAARPYRLLLAGAVGALALGQAASIVVQTMNATRTDLGAAVGSPL